MTSRAVTAPDLTAEEAGTIAAIPTGLFIGGEWRAASSRATFEVEDPATEDVLAKVADASVEDGRAALDAAVAAQAGWAATAPRERGEVLRRAFEVMMDRGEQLALLMTLEMGKPLAESRSEVAYGAEFFRWFSEEAVRIGGGYATTPDGTGRMLTMRQPVGPCLLITPWNFPLAMATRKIGPALAAGCTVVLKPAELTPLSSLATASILAEAGLPAGVVNVVPTSRAAEVTGPLIKDPRLRKLSFTGSTEVGHLLMAQAADQLLRLSMELGGNAPFLVFEDADLDAAVAGAMVAKMRNGGEACTAANRFHVAESVAGAFSEKLTEAMAAVKVGRGTEDGVRLGPLVDVPTLSKVTELVEDARAKGATATIGGQPLDGPGHFYPPTVLTGVTPGTRCLSEEIFGPVAPITTFATEEEAVAQANATHYGLVAYLYTTDLTRALRVVEALESGMVGLNQGMVSNPAAPFGGVKHSGLGREGGALGIEEYLSTKYVATHL